MTQFHSRVLISISLLILLSVSSGSLSQKSSENIKILFLGDSLTAGYGVDKELAYPTRVGDLLKKEFPNKNISIINGGISGSTSQSGISRLKWQIKAKPTHLFLALGANDGLRGQPAKNLEKNLNDVVEFAKGKNLKVILAGMKVPPNYGSKYAKDFEGAFKRVAEKNTVIMLEFLLEGVAGEPELNQADGIHPNEKGHEKIAKHVFEFMRKQIK